MTIQRSKPPSNRTDELARRLNDLYGPCIACAECHGMCPALIEALILPDVILNKETDGA